jgi:hypothetical protein
MFALLQIYPPEALDLDWRRDCGVEVLAIGETEEQLDRLAADYEQRYRAAHQEWAAWDGLSCDWGAAHDRKLAELERRYRVSSPTIGDMRWEIVEVWTPAPELGTDLRAVA